MQGVLKYIYISGDESSCAIGHYWGPRFVSVLTWESHSTTQPGFRLGIPCLYLTAMLILQMASMVLASQRQIRHSSYMLRLFHKTVT